MCSPLATNPSLTVIRKARYLAASVQETKCTTEEEAAAAAGTVGAMSGGLEVAEAGDTIAVVVVVGIAVVADDATIADTVHKSDIAHKAARNGPLSFSWGSRHRWYSY